SSKRKDFSMSNFVVTKYPHGTFCWADCASTDVTKCKAFYSAVFGCETEDIPMSETEFYTFFKKDGKTVAAIAPMRSEMKDMGIPSYWSNYVNVDDADAALAKAESLGATVVAPVFDVFDSGRMGVIQDPSGANLGLW